MQAKYFLGEVGAASRMKIVVNMTMGSMLAAFAEGMALAEACDLPVQDLLSIVDQVTLRGRNGYVDE